MRKINFKSFAMGFLACIVLSNSLSYAAQFKPIQVAVDTVKRIIINGADKTPTTFTPFTYEGNTYVPLSYIAEALDMKVKWDNKTATIYINDSGNAREDVYISSYAYEEMSAAGRLVTKDENSRKLFYFEGIQPDKYRDSMAPSTISYKLDNIDKSGKLQKKYKHIVGKFGFIDGTKSSQDIHTQLVIYDDGGKVLYQSPFIRSNMEMVNLKVDVSNAKGIKFEIKTTSFNKGAKANIGFVDLRLSNE